MSGAKHSPAPWRIVASTPSLIEAVTVEPRERDDGYRIIAQALDPIPHIGAERMWANARVAAAAPDMLAALRELRHEIVHDPDSDLSRSDFDAMCARADAAIAKAEGRP